MKARDIRQEFKNFHNISTQNKIHFTFITRYDLKIIWQKINRKRNDYFDNFLSLLQFFSQQIFYDELFGELKKAEEVMY